VVVRGRDLLPADEWHQWEQRIENTVARTATVEGDLANWRTYLIQPEDTPPRVLMQFCHGAPGFVISLAALPGPALDRLLLAGGEATWAAGPLLKGANLCHGTGGNGYAFLKLFRRTGDERWLTRARAFAMHGIVQCERDGRALRPAARVALDRRPRVRDLPLELHRGRRRLPVPRRVLRAVLTAGVSRRRRAARRETASSAMPTRGRRRRP
jgi:hypothetical protein